MLRKSQNHTEARKYADHNDDEIFGYSHKDCCRAILGGYRPNRISDLPSERFISTHLCG